MNGLWADLHKRCISTHRYDQSFSRAGEILMWPLCIGISRWSAILPIQVFGIYTWDIGLSVSWYSGVDDRLSILPIFVCDIHSEHIFISRKQPYIALLCEFLVSVFANIGWYFTEISVSPIPVIPIFERYMQFENPRFQYHQYFTNWFSTTL